MSIDGLKLSITTEELKKIVLQRIEYHQGRAGWFKELEPGFSKY